MRKLLAAIVVTCISSPAFCQTPSTQEWVAQTMMALTFTDGRMDEKALEQAIIDFTSKKAAFYKQTYGNLVKWAEKSGRQDIAERQKRLFNLKIENLSKLRKDYLVNTVHSLDANADQVVEHEEAEHALKQIAAHADLNDDGFLDEEEQSLAEWRLTTGQNIPEKNNRMAVVKQLIIIEAQNNW